MTRRKVFTLITSLVALAAISVLAVADHHEENAVAGLNPALEFAPFGEGGAQVAVLHGDPTSGPSTILLKIPAGHRNPVHTHSANYTATVVTGHGKQWNHPQTEDDVEAFGPGDVFAQKAGDYHAELMGDEEVIVVVTFDGPVDMVLMDSE